MPKTSAQRKAHWRAPATILVALACGILFAAGHHLFYSSLAGEPAPSDAYNILGTNVSRQQLNIAGGTAFALLVKTSLVISLSSVFVQLFWLAITRQSSHEITLQSLDNIFDSLTDLFFLFREWFCWQYPLLFSLALTIW